MKMKTFFLGFVAAFLIFPAAALGYFRLGLASTPSDAEPPAWEGRIMQSTVRASIRRSAASMQVPAGNFEDNIVEGGKLYFNGCMGCHGEPGKPGADHSHYPRVPQLPQVGTQYSPAEIHWIVQHGIRHTAMSAYGPFYSDKQLWTLAAFVRKINHLSADELERIHPSKAIAGTTP
jgi:mono/diheme cytochrome c family protein